MKIHGTAKGGALSKKDFGVAFAGAAAEVTCENPDEMESTAGVWDTNENFHGIELDGTSSCLYGKTISSFELKLLREGSSTDLFYFVVIPAGSGTTPDATSAGVAQNTLTEAANLYSNTVAVTLNLTSSHTMADGDRIGLWYEGSQKIRMLKSATIESANGYLGVVYQGGWATGSGIGQGYVKAVGS